MELELQSEQLEEGGGSLVLLPLSSTELGLLVYLLILWKMKSYKKAGKDAKQITDTKGCCSSRSISTKAQLVPGASTLSSLAVKLPTVPFVICTRVRRESGLKTHGP